MYTLSLHDALPISNLKARGNSIRVEWVAPPTPDLFTFRILRSEDGAAWTKVSIDPSFPPQVKCEDVPPEGRDWALGLGPGMHEGVDGNGQPLKNAYWYEDKQGIKANTKYYYKVVAVDYNKNPAADSEGGSVSAISSSIYLPWRTSPTSGKPSRLSECPMALPWGSSTPFLRVT